jgi:hypothetical protein
VKRRLKTDISSKIIAKFFAQEKSKPSSFQ